MRRARFARHSDGTGSSPNHVLEPGAPADRDCRSTDAPSAPLPAPTDFPVDAVYAGFKLPETGELRLWRAASPYALLDDPRYVREFEQRNELMPYWGELWPAGRFLAHYLARRFSDTDRQLDVLEVGAGIGAAGLAMARLGHRVTLTDAAPDALRILEIHVRENGLDAGSTCSVAMLDYFAPCGWASRYDMIIGSDVLFERRNSPAVARVLRNLLKPDGLALISDPCRRTAEPFAADLRGAGFSAGIDHWSRNDLMEEAMDASPPMRLFRVRGS